jgi:hypothetical protein
VTRPEIEAELLRWMRTEPDLEDEARFERLALGLFAWQFERCLPYRRFCSGRGATPDRVSRWQEIPTVPTGAFKEVPLRCFDAKQEIKTFRTSGTSHASANRGELHLDTLELYEASLAPSFERGLLPDLAPGARIPIWILAPSAEEAPDSSLSHMFSVMNERRGSAGGGFFVRNGALQLDRLFNAAREIEDPVLLCGTAFSFVHWLDDLDERDMNLHLPPGTRLMETGGFKGRARERSRGELYAELEERLGVPQQRMINQYGMTELGSQFYDAGLMEPGREHKRVPPWVRVRIVDPGTGQEASDGDLGMIEIVDLANTGSVAAIATADLGRRVDKGFLVEGRDPNAEARGCSIAADEMLGADD